MEITPHFEDLGGGDKGQVCVLKALLCCPCSQHRHGLLSLGVAPVTLCSPKGTGIPLTVHRGNAANMYQMTAMAVGVNYINDQITTCEENQKMFIPSGILLISHFLCRTGLNCERYQAANIVTAQGILVGYPWQREGSELLGKIVFS